MPFVNAPFKGADAFGPASHRRNVVVFGDRGMRLNNQLSFIRIADEENTGRGQTRLNTSSRSQAIIERDYFCTTPCIVPAQYTFKISQK